MCEEFFDQFTANYAHYKSDDRWCYEDGCLYRGLVELYRATGDELWRRHLLDLISQQVHEDGTLHGYSVDEYNIDNILTGRVLFFLLETGDERYAKAADLLARQLASHPRTEGGNYWHKQIYPHQVWLDGLYMGLPFQIEYGLTRGDDSLVTDALDQLERAIAIMRDPKTGLYYHGYDESRAKAWADPETGLSKSFWSRAIGWLAMALIDTYALLPDSHPRRADIGEHVKALADAILRYRTPNGLWLQVIDRPDLPGNYEELSGSAMFTYFLLRAGRLIPGCGPLAEEGRAALEAIEAHHIAVSDQGEWSLGNICEVAGLGPFRGRERDGTPEYYTTEKIITNDAKGVGPLMMAVAESWLLSQQTDEDEALGVAV